MKYTAKQIEKAFLMWEQDIRCRPDEFMSEEEREESPAEEIADLNTKDLISYM